MYIAFPQQLTFYLTFFIFLFIYVSWMFLVCLHYIAWKTKGHHMVCVSWLNKTVGCSYSRVQKHVNIGINCYSLLTIIKMWVMSDRISLNLFQVRLCEGDAFSDGWRKCKVLRNWEMVSSSGKVVSMATLFVDSNLDWLEKLRCFKSRLKTSPV